MKRKVIAAILSLMVGLQLAACGAVGGTTGSADHAAEAGTDSTKEAADDAADGEGAAAPAVTTGGSPWLDSDLKENVTADMPVDPKEDFHLYVNRDWIAATDIPEGEVCYMRLFSAAADETEKKAAALFTDIMRHAKRCSCMRLPLMRPIPAAGWIRTSGMASAF